MQNLLHYYDPCFRTAIIAPGMPIFWDMVPKTTKKAAAIMRERCETVGVISGVTMSFKHDHQTLLI